MRIHQDWRGKIHDVLRQKRTKLTGAYIQRNLDRFNLLLPRLVIDREVVMQRRDISALTDGEWSEASIGKFLHHLEKTNVVAVRYAGSRGLGLTLKVDLTESPWKSRRSDVGNVAEKTATEVEQSEPPKEDVESTKMTAAPQPVRQYQVPQDDDYCTHLDLDLTLAAIDKVAQRMLMIDLSFAKEFSGDRAARLYEAQEAVSICVQQLGQIRSAIGAGDNSDLEDIVGRTSG